MALSNPSLLTTLASATFGTSNTTSSISPTANSLLIVSAGVGTGGSVSRTLSISDTLSGTGSWNQAFILKNNSDTFLTAIFWAFAGSSPGSGTITVTASAGMARWCIAVHEITGADTSTPVLQSKTGSNASTSLSLTLDSTPLTPSVVFGTVTDRVGNGATAGSGFTETADFSSGGGGNAYMQTQYKNGSATTTCDWSDLNTLNNTAVAIEIQELVASGGGGQIKAYTGSSFEAKPVKVWNGSAWETKPLKVYNGSSWGETSY